MYSEELLDLYAEKPNVGHLKKKTNEADHDNPVCGDNLHIELDIQDGIIKDAKYVDKKGCFVSIISASALTEEIKGMKTEDVLKLSKKDIDELLGKEIIETRIKCELLPLEAIKKAIIESK